MTIWTSHRGFIVSTVHSGSDPILAPGVGAMIHTGVTDMDGTPVGDGIPGITEAGDIHHTAGMIIIHHFHLVSAVTGADGMEDTIPIIQTITADITTGGTMVITEPEADFTTIIRLPAEDLPK